jgi:hypothetical protein
MYNILQSKSIAKIKIAPTFGINIYWIALYNHNVTKHEK